MRSHGGVVTALAIGGKLAATGAFNVVYVFSAEVYPASVRGAGFGLCNVCARAGGLLAPLSMILPLELLFAAYALAAALAMLATLRYMDETLGLPLQQQMLEDKLTSDVAGCTGTASQHHTDSPLAEP